jgi:GTPase
VRLFVSAFRAMGLGKLEKRLEHLIEEDYVTFSYNIPLTHYKAVSFLHEVAVIDKEHFEGNEVTIKGSSSKSDIDRFESMLSDIKPLIES